MPETLAGHWLSEPRLRFDYENRAALSSDAFTGLKTWGPSDIGEQRKLGHRVVRAVIIGRADRQDAMRDARAALENHRMGKLHDVFDLKIVEELLVPATKHPREEATAYSEAVQSWLHRSRNGPKVQLAFVLHDDEEMYNKYAKGISPYYASKAELLMAGIPTQNLCYKNLEPGKRLEDFRRYYVPNILTASYAKLGGKPWVIEDDAVGRPEITLGVAMTAIYPDRNDAEAERYVGISTIFKENGAFALWSLTPLKKDLDEYEVSLEDSIVDAIETYEQMENKRVSRIACHVSGKRAGRREIEAIKRALDRFNPRTIAADLVHITQDATLWLLDGTHETLRPKAGFLTQLSGDGRVALMHTEGRNSSAKKYAPRPLKLRVHSDTSADGPDDIYQHLYDLRWMSWRGVGTASKPVSIDYPARMAKLLAYLHNQEKVDALKFLPRLNTSAWFL